MKRLFPMVALVLFLAAVAWAGQPQGMAAVWFRYQQAEKVAFVSGALWGMDASMRYASEEGWDELKRLTDPQEDGFVPAIVSLVDAFYSIPANADRFLDDAILWALDQYCEKK